MAENQAATATVPVTLPAGKVTIPAHLAVPRQARGLVLLVQVGGNGRSHPVNRLAAEKLSQAGFATCMLDLLTPEETSRPDIQRDLSSNAAFLAGRLEAATEYLVHMAEMRDLRIGYLGYGVGAAAALAVAARRPERVCAVVSRGGRPDLAGPFLERVVAPVLLIAGENDAAAARAGQEAYSRLPEEKGLHIIPRASLEDRAVLAEVDRLSAAWFEKYLCGFAA